MILIGTKCRLEQTVTDALTAANVGSGALPVFGTPYMSALMENAAMTCLQSFLEEGQGSVGTHLDISHDAPTPIGMKVWAEAEIDRSIDLRRQHPTGLSPPGLRRSGAGAGDCRRPGPGKTRLRPHLQGQAGPLLRKIRLCERGRLPVHPRRRGMV